MYATEDTIFWHLCNAHTRFVILPGNNKPKRHYITSEFLKFVGPKGADFR